LAGTVIRILRLRADGGYEEVSRSEILPQIGIAAIGPFLAQGKDKDYLTTMRAFREWIRQQLGRGRGPDA
jgi:hypothetical protein